MAPTPRWIERAACRGEDPEVWFPDDEYTEDFAVTVCALRCPVRWECLDKGLDEEFGIWGGATETARKEMSRKMRRLPDPPQEMIGSLGAGRRLRALAHLGWATHDIATDVRRYSGVTVRPGFLEEIRDGLHEQVTEELHVALVRSYTRNRSRFNSRGNTGNTIDQAKRCGWPTARMWRGLDIDNPDTEPGHDDFA